MKIITNERTVCIRIPGKPISKLRPGQNRKTGVVFKKASQRDAELNVFDWTMHQLPKDFELFTGGVAVYIVCHVPRPLHHFGTGKNDGRLKPSSPKMHLFKPDIDNIEKFYLDAQQHILWNDDTQVVLLVGIKIYSDVKRFTGENFMIVTPLEDCVYDDLAGCMLSQIKNLMRNDEK